MVYIEHKGKFYTQINIILCCGKLFLPVLPTYSCCYCY